MAKILQIGLFIWQVLKQPRVFFNASKNFVWQQAGADFAKRYQEQAISKRPPKVLSTADNNPLLTYFREHTSGKGIWKWEHYFDIYHRHFQPFIGKAIKVLEVGVYSGGSLDMWLHYFGDDCQVIGVDIEEACRTYASDRVSIAIGDQADPAFWTAFFDKYGFVDIVIDDGGHLPVQQKVTLEAVLPMLQPGGIYLCEDIIRNDNAFAAYAGGLVQALHDYRYNPDNERQVGASLWQAAIKAIHCYPYVLVIEKNEIPITDLHCPQKGSEWQPFFD